MMGGDKAEARRPWSWGAGGLGMEVVTREMLDFRGGMSRSRGRG